MEENLDRFIKMLEEDPKSRAFAPLAEGYRRQGLLEKALQIASDGVALHPDFHSGKVALARVLMDLKKWTAAEVLLFEVVEADYENLLAHRLIGEIQIKQERFSEALNSFKSALLINPNDKISQAMVNKLEAFSIEGFKDGILFETDQEKILSEQSLRGKLNLDAALSYTDALIYRNCYESALKYIDANLSRFPGNSELMKRRRYLENLKSIGQKNISKKEVLAKPEVNNLKIKSLTRALHKIEGELASRAEVNKFKV